MKLLPILIMAVSLGALLLLASCGQGQRRETPPTEAPREGKPQATLSPLQLAEGLYAANCQVCHGDRDGRGTTIGAPPHNQTGHTWHHTDAQLKDWILRGKPSFGGSPNMPAFRDRLTEGEVDAILGLIKTWWTADQQASQADVSRRYQESIERQKKGE